MAPLLLLLAACDDGGSSDLEAQLADLQATVDALQADHDTLQAEHDALQADHDAVKADLATVQADQAALAGRADTLEATVADHADRLDALDAAVAGLGFAAVVRTQTFGSIPGSTHVNFVVECEAGEVAVGGGAGFAGNLGAEEVQQSYPINADGSAATAGETPAGWVTILKNNSSTAMVATGYVVCARP